MPADPRRGKVPWRVKSALVYGRAAKLDATNPAEHIQAERIINDALDELNEHSPGERARALKYLGGY